VALEPPLPSYEARIYNYMGIDQGIRPVLEGRLHLDLSPAPVLVEWIPDLMGSEKEDNLQKPSPGLALKNRPNPFLDRTEIYFSDRLSSNERMRFNIYNLTGQLVRSLEGQRTGNGDCHAVWDGKDQMNARVGAGTYFLRCDRIPHSQTLRMVLLP